MHEILALAMEKLHFESFLETYEKAEDICSLVIQKLRIIKEQNHLEKHEWSQEIEEFWKLAIENGGQLQTTG